jgi:MoaA/NifB/PqqE/SkfB family radical SAM enzyme
MCDSWRMKPGSELSVAQVRQVFAKIGSLDVVRLTGGEPFLREDFSELAQAIHETAAPRILHITTNGSFPDTVEAFVKRFPAPARLCFMVSFDGLEKEHDLNRGPDVSFARAEETVRRLAALRQYAKIRVSINHTIFSPASMEAHELLCQRFRPLGVDVHAVLAYSDSAMYGLKRFGSKAQDLIPVSGYPLHPNLRAADVVGFIQRLLRQLPRLRNPLLRWGKRYYLRGLLARLENRPRPLPHPPCVALRSHLRLLPDGRVPVCQFNTETVGNLLHQSLADIWHAEATQRQRAWVDACPGCWAECEVMPSAIYTGDLLVSAGSAGTSRGAPPRW